MEQSNNDLNNFPHLVNNPSNPIQNNNEEIPELTEDQKLEFLHLFALFVNRDKKGGNNEEDGEDSKGNKKKKSKAVEKPPEGITQNLTPEELEATKLKTINADGLLEVCKSHGYGHSARDPIKLQDVEVMMKEVDEDGMGEIDFDEFLHLMAKHLNENELVDEVCKAFQVLNVKIDVEDTGEESLKYISANELKDAMTNYGEKLTDEEVDELFNEANITYGKELDIEDFVRTTLLK